MKTHPVHGLIFSLPPGSPELLVPSTIIHVINLDFKSQLQFQIQQKIKITQRENLYIQEILAVCQRSSNFPPSVLFRAVQLSLSSFRLPTWNSSRGTSPAIAGDTGDTVSIPGLGKFPGVGNYNPLQYSSLENPIGQGGQWATVMKLQIIGHN